MKWLLLSVLLVCGAADARTPLTTATRDFYVATNGSDANDCRQTTPCLTIQRAVDNIKQNYDSNCVQPWIHISPGIYAGWEDYGPQVGCHPKGGGPLVIAGTMGNLGSDCVDPDYVKIISPNGVNAVSLDGGAIQTIICMTISASGASAIYTTNGGKAEIGLMNFGTANTQVFADAGGAIFVTSTLNFMQGATYGVQANLGGLVYFVPGVAVSFASGIGYSQQFIHASNGGKIVFSPLTVGIAGSPSGQKCFASLLGIVNTGGYAAYLPGASACSSNTGGVVH